MNLIKKFLKPSTPFLKAFPPLWIALFVILVGVDLATKKVVTDHLNFNIAPHQRVNMNLSYMNRQKAEGDGTEQIDLIGEKGHIAKFKLLFNDRFVFGSGPSAPVMGFFLTLGAVLFLFFYRWNNPGLGYPIAWLFVFSGAFGNLIDKMFVKSLITREWVFSIFPRPLHMSGVVDFIEVIWFGWKDASTYCFFGRVCPLSFLSWETWPTFNIADSLIVVGITLLVFSMRDRSVATRQSVPGQSES